MAKDQPSLISVDDDVRGIYSVSDFLNYMSDRVSWSDSKSFSHLKVFFWNQDHQIELKQEGIGSIKDKIKSALQFLDIFHFPTLVQFWARNVGSQQFLETFDFPFGISVLRKGLCSYRKKCLNYKYSVDAESNEGEDGPVGRVFRNGFPEFSPDVGLYSEKEYKLKDFAVFCGVKGYLALPVFESGGQRCVGVLELMSIWDGSYCLTDKLGKVDEALKAVGLRLSGICSPFDMERSSQHEVALTEIKKVLEAACCTHKLPFAQAWFCSEEKNCSGDILCTSETGSYMLAKSVSSFQKECIQLCLKRGQSVVWRAFTSGTSCFCRDIKQLTITEYSLVNSARKFDFTSCFTTCLQSTDTGSNIYVLEFFLPSMQLVDREPQAFLDSLLATVRKHSQSFKVASGQEHGAESSVEVIKLYTDNEVDSFKICRTPRSPEVSQSQMQKLKLFTSESSGRNCLGKGNIIKVDIDHSGKELGSGAGKSLHLSSDSAISPPRIKDLHKRKADDGTKALRNKRKADYSLSQQQCVRGAKNHIVELHQTNRTRPVCSPKEGTNSTPNPTPQAAAVLIESPVIIKASYEENIIKFELSLTSGIRDFEKEVEKRLENLKAGSYEIKHLNDDNSRISLTSDADLQNIMRTMVSPKKTTIKFHLEPVKIQHIQRCSNSVTCPLPQTAEIQNETPMFIKVTHNNDTIKFQLSLSAGMVELKHEVMKRLQLSANSFGIKYLGEENKWILIASDSELQSYMSNMRSKEIKTVRFSLDLTTN